MISVIIPVLNQHELTDICINEVLRTVDAKDLELIIVDNGSEPPIKPPFSGFAETKLIRNEDNKGFPAAVNQGMREATGDVIVLLNNDVIVTNGWALKLVSALEEFDIVGPVTNYCAGMQKVQAETYEDIADLNKSAGDWAENWDDSVEPVNFIIGFCMAFRKSLFDELGDFDESLWPCCGEEVDFCFRAKEAGKHVAIVNGCYVHHEGSKTFADLEESGKLDYAAVCKKTDAHLFEKWGGNFWERQAISSSPEPIGICLNLGCGYHKLNGFINIDNRAEVGPDLVCDVLAGLPYEDGSVDMVRAYDFLEHIPIGSTVGVVSEIWRVLKPGGVFESLTPSTDGRGAFMDPTHVSFWNCHSWLYYSDDQYRGLYDIKANFEIESIEDKEIISGMGTIHTHVIAKAKK